MLTTSSRRPLKVRERLDLLAEGKGELMVANYPQLLTALREDRRHLGPKDLKAVEESQGRRDYQYSQPHPNRTGK